MSHNPESENDEISKLLYNCGISVNMDFVYCGSWTNTSSSASALVTYFNYNSAATYIENKTNTELATAIINQISQERPVQLRGQPQPGGGTVGHSWICSGYQRVSGYPISSTLFWFNWGWGGQFNGYFSLGSSAYPMSQLNYLKGAVINIYPRIQPDLTITSASVSQNPICSGNPFNLNYNIINEGDRDVDTSRVSFYRSDDQSLDGGDTFLHSTQIKALSS